MADVAITPASVVKGAGAVMKDGIAGATITAGQVLYEDTADSNKLKLADANAASPANVVAGIALHGAAAGQPLKYLTGEEVTIGGTLVQGQVYVLSATAGGIAPAADLTTGWVTTILGIAKTTGILKVTLQTAGVAV